MNVHVTPDEPNVELPLADAKKRVEAATGAVPTGPRPGRRKVWEPGVIHPDLRVPFAEIAVHPSANEPPARSRRASAVLRARARTPGRRSPRSSDPIPRLPPHGRPRRRALPPGGSC